MTEPEEEMSTSFRPPLASQGQKTPPLSERIHLHEAEHKHYVNLLLAQSLQ